jgi:hypothetical protein
MNLNCKKMKFERLTGRMASVALPSIVEVRGDELQRSAQ